MWDHGLVKEWYTPNFSHISGKMLEIMAHLKTAMKGMNRTEEVQSTRDRQNTRMNSARLLSPPAIVIVWLQNWERRNPDAVPTASSR